MEKVLSIIIPTYNMEKYLNKCLDSLIVPNMDLLEVLVINDGSKDRSSEIAHEYEKKYPNVFRVIDKENGNYGSCVNRGLIEASGKYFRILDADDYYSCEDLNSFLQYLLKSDTDIVFTSFTVRDFNNNIKERLEIPKVLVNGSKFIENFDFNSHFEQDVRRMHCITTKTAILKSNKYFQTENISYTDMQFVFYSILYSSTVGFCDYNIYQYCLGRDGQTMSVSSMIKNHNHFYLNAKRLLLEYKNYVKGKTDSYKVSSLRSCISCELICYRDITMSYLNNNTRELNLLNELIEIGYSSEIPYMIEQEIPSKRLLMWQKFKINPRYLNWFFSKRKTFN